jgi:hypothetical protein
MWLPCPYLRGQVELTAERWDHIAERHPDLLPGDEPRIAETMAEPDSVRRNSRADNTRLFTRWFPDLHGGKHVVVIVASADRRDWIVTAFITRRLPREGDIEWMRS